MRRQLEQRPRTVGPALGRGDCQRLLRREMVKEGALGHARRRADLIDRRRGIALLAHHLMRRGDQPGARAAPRGAASRWDDGGSCCGGFGRGLIRRHANRHTDQLVCCQTGDDEPHQGGVKMTRPSRRFA